MKPEWTADRIKRLFDEYNERFWDGRLPNYRISTQRFSRAFYGKCNWRRHVIKINTTHIESYEKLRHTLLHEMAHAGNRSRGGRGAGHGAGHGVGFVEQLEMLLRKRAPFRLDASDVRGYLRLVLEIPKRFPLCRKAVRRLQARSSGSGSTIPDSYEELSKAVFKRLRQKLRRGGRWEPALQAVIKEFGLEDMDGWPMSMGTARLVEQMRRLYSMGELSGRKDAGERPSDEAITELADNGYPWAGLRRAGRLCAPPRIPWRKTLG